VEVKLAPRLAAGGVNASGGEGESGGRQLPPIADGPFVGEKSNRYQRKNFSDGTPADHPGLDRERHGEHRGGADAEDEESDRGQPVVAAFAFSELEVQFARSSAGIEKRWRKAIGRNKSSIACAETKYAIRGFSEELRPICAPAARPAAYPGAPRE